jgi:hypothetical protein
MSSGKAFAFHCSRCIGFLHYRVVRMGGLCKPALRNEHCEEHAKRALKVTEWPSTDPTRATLLLVLCLGSSLVVFEACFQCERERFPFPPHQGTAPPPPKTGMQSCRPRIHDITWTMERRSPKNFPLLCDLRAFPADGSGFQYCGPFVGIVSLAVSGSPGPRPREGGCEDRPVEPWGDEGGGGQAA